MSTHVLDDIPALLAGELGRTGTRSAVVHLRDCDECRRDLVDAVHAHAALTSAQHSGLLDAVGPGDLPGLSLPGLTVPGSAGVSGGTDVPSGGTDVPSGLSELPGPTGSAPAADGPESAWLAQSAARGATTPLPPLPDRTSRSIPHRHRRLLAVAAAVAVLAGGTVAAVEATRPAPTPSRSAALQPVGSIPASGTVTMTGSTGDATMAISARLPDPGSRHYYEVWLFEPASNKMLPVGVLSPEGTLHAEVPAATLAEYRAVDISLEADDGNPGHSTTSVLRTTYA